MPTSIFQSIRLLLQKPTDLALHCLQRQGISGFSRTRVKRCFVLFVCVEVLQPSQPNGVMSSAVSLPYHTFTGQA